MNSKWRVPDANSSRHKNFYTLGEKWKALRSKMSPTFTTGKIKRMFNLIDESAKRLVEYVKKEAASNKPAKAECTEVASG